MIVLVLEAMRGDRGMAQGLGQSHTDRGTAGVTARWAAWQGPSLMTPSSRAMRRLRESYQGSAGLSGGPGSPWAPRVGDRLTPSRAAGRGVWLSLAAGLFQGGSFGIRVTAQETRPQAPLPRALDGQIRRRRVTEKGPPPPAKLDNKPWGGSPQRGGRERGELPGPPGSWSLVAASDLRLECTPPCVPRSPGQQLPNPRGSKEDPQPHPGQQLQWLRSVRCTDST